jgi:hypothetical protein
MGSLRGEDGDGRTSPDDGGLPNLPPEWGTVVIPDDPSELDRETSEYQRATKRAARHSRWRRRLHLPPKSDNDSPPVGTPLLIMCIAIVAALTSLFAVTVTTHNKPDPTATTTPGPQATPQMVDLGLADSTGKVVRTDDHLPAVFLLLDGCACSELIADTVAAAPASVAVIVVDKTPPYVPVGSRATALGDPSQALLALYGGGADWDATPAGQPTALLVDSSGAVTSTVSAAFNVSDFRGQLTALK